MSNPKKPIDIDHEELSVFNVEPPNISIEFADFLAYLMKRGYIVSLKECVRDYGELFDVEVEVNRIGKERLEYVKNVLKKPCKTPGICVTRIGDEKVVFLSDRSWADKWARHYKVNLPHHRQWTKL